MENGNKKKQVKGTTAGSCDSCSFYVYDEEYDDYMCQVNMDEDDAMRLLSDEKYECPYYQLDDEYRVVRKQM